MRKKMTFFVTFSLLLICNLQLYAQEVKIKGIVRNAAGESLPGATVGVKGTPDGVITNFDGEFKLSVYEDDVLLISFMGYVTQKVEVGNKREFEIVLLEEATEIEDIIIVGYGVQKKENLTGAVSSINTEELTESRPITSISSGLAGLASGVYIRSSSNSPTSDNAIIRVRGQGTLNNSAPLVIIDGVSGNINSVNPEDIASISILKDAASSSIYGSRAANGVILIQTKKGKDGRFQLNYNGYVSAESVVDAIEPVTNYADYMELINEGMNKSIFSEEVINTWRKMEGKDPIRYANNDWRKEVFRPAFSQNHSLSLSGGTDRINFFTSFRYLNNPGVIENSGVKRYDLRSNVNAKLNDVLTLGTNFTGSQYDLGIGADVLNNVFYFAQASTPGFVLRAPDGRYGSSSNDEDDPQANNVLHRLNESTGEHKYQRLAAKVYGILTPFEGFKIEGSFNYETSNRKKWKKPIFLDRWNFLTNSIASSGRRRTYISNQSSKTNRFFIDYVATYEKSLSRLYIKTMLGGSQELYTTEGFYTSKQDLIDPSLSVINAAIGDASASGSKKEWAMRSYFARANFNWAEKYLLEINLRIDESSKFLKSQRRGYFPSFSAGWRIDKESFMSGLVDNGLSRLKLRGSYGSLGNNSVGYYDALSVYSISNYVLNGSVQQGLVKNAIANSLLTWEKTYIANIGLDFGFFKGRLDGTVEIFNKTTKDILINLPAPLVHGRASIPKQNSATVENKGIELTLGWQDKINDFSYYIKGNISHIKNKVVKYKDKNYSIINNGIIQEGYPIQAQYLLTVDRIIETQADLDLVQEIIDNAPIDENTGNKRDPFASYGKPELGDLLYKDINNDGVINDDDRTVFGDGILPSFVFGLNLGFEYKGFDFSTLIQGVAGIKEFYCDQYYSPQVRKGYQINKEIAEGRWYEGRKTPAEFPRLLQYTNNRNIIGSDFWLKDKSYLKIRNIQIGYSLPKQTISGIGIQRLRVYVSLENYFTFTSYPGIDPEVSNTAYPTMRQSVIGINLSF